jgi:ribokinase
VAREENRMNESSESKDATWDILGFGAIAVDDLIYLDAFPTPDSKIRVQSRERHGGGLCATALVAASKLGARCAFAGVLGDDELSRFSIGELQSAGVDVSQVLAHSTARPRHSTILIESQHQTRTILSSAEGAVPFPPERITPQVLARTKVLFLDHTSGDTGLAATRIARDLRIPMVADIERLNVPALSEWLPLVDHLIVGEKLARELSPELDVEDVARDLGRNRALAVVTRGADGSVACGRDTGGQVLVVPAFAVEAVDTTGCGDVFHGAYAAELARGSEVLARLKMASAVAAIKAQHRGGRGGLPTRDEALALFT